MRKLHWLEFPVLHGAMICPRVSPTACMLYILEAWFSGVCGSHRTRAGNAPCCLCGDGCVEFTLLDHLISVQEASGQTTVIPPHSHLFFVLFSSLFVPYDVALIGNIQNAKTILINHILRKRGGIFCYVMQENLFFWHAFSTWINFSRKFWLVSFFLMFFNFFKLYFAQSHSHLSKLKPHFSIKFPSEQTQVWTISWTQ